MKNKSTIQFILLMTVITLIAIAMTSCTTESTHLEKVVILDEMPMIHIDTYYDLYEYKIQRIEHGVVTHIKTEKRFDAGDTIYYSFVNTIASIQSIPKTPKCKIYYEYNIYNSVDTIPIDTVLIQIP